MFISASHCNVFCFFFRLERGSERCKYLLRAASQWAYGGALKTLPVIVRHPSVRPSIHLSCILSQPKFWQRRSTQSQSLQFFSRPQRVKQPTTFTHIHTVGTESLQLPTWTLVRLPEYVKRTHRQLPELESNQQPPDIVTTAHHATLCVPLILTRKKKPFYFRRFVPLTMPLPNYTMTPPKHHHGCEAHSDRCRVVLGWCVSLEEGCGHPINTALHLAVVT